MGFSWMFLRSSSWILRTTVILFSLHFCPERKKNDIWTKYEHVSKLTSLRPQLPWFTTRRHCLRPESTRMPAEVVTTSALTYVRTSSSMLQRSLICTCSWHYACVFRPSDWTIFHQWGCCVILRVGCQWWHILAGSSQKVDRICPQDDLTVQGGQLPKIDGDWWEWHNLADKDTNGQSDSLSAVTSQSTRDNCELFLSWSFSHSVDKNFSNVRHATEMLLSTTNIQLQMSTYQTETQRQTDRQKDTKIPLQMNAYQTETETERQTETHKTRQLWKRTMRRASENNWPIRGRRQAGGKRKV